MKKNNFLFLLFCLSAFLFLGCGDEKIVFLSADKIYVYDFGGLEGFFGGLNDPERLSSYETIEGGGGNIFSKGKYLYLATGYGLEIVSISDLKSPKRVGDLNFKDGTKYDIFVEGDYAYIVGISYDGDNDTMWIFDVSDPKSPKMVSSYEVSGCASKIFVYKNYAYIAGAQSTSHFCYSGVYIIDVSNPASPKEVAKYTDLRIAYSVVVNDDKAFVADDDNCGLVLDVSNPASPKKIGTLVQGRCAVYDIIISGKTVYMGGMEGVVGVDISNLDSPKVVGNIGTVSRVSRLDKSGNYVFALNDGRIRLFKSDNFEHIHLTGAYSDFDLPYFISTVIAR